MFDVTNQRSLESLSRWVREFIKQADIQDPSNFPFLIVANKTDRESERVVTKDAALLKATEILDYCLNTPSTNATHPDTQRRVSLQSKSSAYFSRISSLSGTRRLSFRASSQHLTVQNTNPISLLSKSPSAKSKSTKSFYGASLGAHLSTNTVDSANSFYTAHSELDEISEQTELALIPAVPGSYLASSWITRRTSGVSHSGTSSAYTMLDENEMNSITHDEGIETANNPSLQPSTPEPTSPPALPYFEVSAKSGDNIPTPFEYIANHVVIPKFEVQSDEDSYRIRLTQPSRRSRKFGCC